MRKLMILGAVMLSLLMVPAMASATHFTNIVGVSDCDGYSADAGVHFRSTAASMDLSYTITLSNMDGDVLETITDSMTVINGGDVVLNFSGLWEADAESESGFTVLGVFDLVSTFPGGVDEDHIEFSNVLSCTVDSENVSFDSVKSMYR